MTNNVGLIFNVGDTTPQCTISVQQVELDMMTLNIIFIVVLRTLNYYSPRHLRRIIHKSLGGQRFLVYWMRDTSKNLPSNTKFMDTCSFTILML